MLRSDDLDQRFAKALLDPVLRRPQRQFFILELFRQRRYEVGLSRDRLRFELAQHHFEGVTSLSRAAGQPVRPEIRRFAQLLALADA